MRPSTATVAAGPKSGRLVPWSDDLTARHGRRWDPAAARRYCAAMLRGSDRSAGLWLRPLPPERAAALTALAAVDAVADALSAESPDDRTRAACLDNWAAAVEACPQGRAEHPALLALGRAAREFELDPAPLAEAVRARRALDGEQPVASWRTLEALEQPVAGPIGRLAAQVLGLARPPLVQRAERLSLAWRWTARWCRLSDALARGRVALPREALERHAVSPRDLLAGRQCPATHALIRAAAAHTRVLYREATPLALEAGLPAALPVVRLWLGGRSLLHLVAEAGAAVLCRRPVLTAPLFVRTLAEAGWSRLLGRAA
jgi:phytoene synthase